MELHAGDVLDDKYEIVGLIGRGGMGVVYEGRHRLIHRRVAIKVLHGALCSQPSVVKRFEREAQAAGRIGSEQVVEVLDVGSLPSGQRYLVMEYLDGQSLARRLEEGGPMPPEHIFPLVIELLEGLSAAHAAGIIHRDLKPDNIWLTRSKTGRGEFVKILDFGISKFRDLEDGSDVSHTGMVVGTPTYMAPEQARGDKNIDHRADLYAVGVLLYRSLSGQMPHEGATYNELIFKVVVDDPPSIGRILPDLDQAIVEIIEKALAREREDRYSDADAFRSELIGWLQRHGFPISLAVLELLQSGDRVGAELLQSGEAWPLQRPESSSDVGAEAAKTLRRLDDRTPRPEASGHAPPSTSVAHESAATQTPTSGPGLHDEGLHDEDLHDEGLHDERTDLLDEGALAAMSAADRPSHEGRPGTVITPSKHKRSVLPAPDEAATIRRQIPPPPAKRAPTSSLEMSGEIQNTAPALGATVAVGTAGIVLLVALIIGIGAASESEPPRLENELHHLTRWLDAQASAAAEDRDRRERPPRDPDSDRHEDAARPGSEPSERARPEPPPPRVPPSPRPSYQPKDDGRTFRRDL